jgi:hypothetical protein
MLLLTFSDSICVCIDVLRRQITVDLEAAPDATIDQDLLQFLRYHRFCWCVVSFSIDSNHQYNSSFFTALNRLKFIEGADSFILEACFASTVYETLSLAFSKANELRVMEYILQFCSQKLENMNTVASPSDDEALLAQGDSSAGGAGTEPIRVALARLRTQERAALTTTIDKVEAEIRSLKVI